MFNVQWSIPPFFHIFLIFSLFSFVISRNWFKLASDSRGHDWFCTDGLVRYRTQGQWLPTPSWRRLYNLLKAGIGWEMRESRHTKRRLQASCLWHLEILQITNRYCQGRGNKDVLGMCFIRIPFQVATIYYMYCVVTLTGVAIFISAWASALLVQQYRAMQEPPSVGRAPKSSHAFLCCSSTIIIYLIR